MEVDRVFAGDDVSDRAAAGLSGRLLAGGLGGGSHFCTKLVSRRPGPAFVQSSAVAAATMRSCSNCTNSAPRTKS